MAGKQEQILKYIESLSPGNRVSVRNLARTMTVSEGTAYKAIKFAESKGLLETKARGSVRIQTPGAGTPEALLLSVIIRKLGLAVLAGGAFTDVPVRSIILGDGDVEQFRRALAGSCGKPLCLVGNRPEIIQEAAAAGANILVTDGTRVNHGQLATAVENNACVLSSAQSSAVLLSHLRGGRSGEIFEGPEDSAGNWMSIPPYLYYNDIVADLHSIYRPVFSLFSKCAVVNDDLQICGTVDALRALSTTPSQKIANLYLPDEDCYAVDENIAMEELADQMITRGVSTAYVTRDEKLCGIIMANDVLRFYRFKAAEHHGITGYPGVLEAIGRDRASGINEYMIRIPEHAADAVDRFPDYLFSLLLNAAGRQCEEVLGAKYDFESGTFYTLCDPSLSGELMVSSELIKKSPSGCTVEAELYDDASCYARCVLVASVPGTDGRRQKGE
jgi:predicted transcriptional regulator